MNFDLRKIPKRILMTADAVGGVWTYALELARALEPFDVEIILATMGAPPGEEQLKEAREIPNLSVFKSEYKLEWMEDCWRDVSLAGEWLLRLERRFCPDIVHLNGFVHAGLPWNAPTMVVGHSCVLSWRRAVKNEPAPAYLNQYREKVRRGLQAADLVIAPTAAMLDALEENYGFLPNKRVIPNGREASLFFAGEKEEFILAAGRIWDEAKNIAALTRAASKISFPVFVAGDEKHPDGKSAARFENVNFLGRLSTETLSDRMSRAAVFALPARYEPFGLTPLEAALSGCALVLGDIPSLREVWRDAALFVPPEDENALAETLENLMTDNTLREEYAKRAKKRASNFTRQKMAKNYLAAYSELLTNSPKAKKESFVCA